MFSIGGVLSAADPALGNTKSLKSDGFLNVSLKTHHFLMILHLKSSKIDFDFAS